MKKMLAGVLASCALFSAAAQSPSVTLSGTGVQEQSYGTIQAALDAIGSRAGDFTITLPKGTYPEVLYYNGPATITLSGDTTARYGKDVVIEKDNDGDLLRLTRAGSAQKNRCLFEFEGTGSLVLENVTFHNTFVRGSVKGSNTQAETVGFDSTGTLAAYNCAFLSHQDTLRTTGKSWFYKCYVEGDTDFIWMEESGKVALFEECEIVSVYDEHASNHTSYIGAPRMTPANRASKGLVIYNCTVSTQDGQTTFLARTPWTSSYYNQVAFVGTKAQGIDAAVWYGKPLTADGIPQTAIGWKMDKATAKSLGVKTSGRNDIISSGDVKREFKGRRAILNRHYDLASLKYRKDTDSYWDIDALISARKWAVSKDASKVLQSGEKDTAPVVYVLDGTKTYDDLTLSGFAQEAGKAHFVGEAGATITFPVAGKSLVAVEGYYAGSGTIAAGAQGAAAYDFNNGSMNKFAEKAYVVYEGAATVTITAAKKSYITKITVLRDDKLSFTPVKSVAITAAENATEIYGRKSLQLCAALNPARPTNGDYVWSVSDENAASISESGLLVAANVTEDTTVKVRAQSRDAKGASAEYTLKILKPEAGAFAVTWLDSPEASASLAGTSDNTAVATAKDAKPSAGKWTFNASKIAADFATGGISYSGYSAPIADKNTVYVEFPLTAAEDLNLTSIEAAFGNHGTGNIAVLITASAGGRTAVLAEDTSRTVRSTKKTFDIAPFAVKKGETATIRVTLYGYAGGEGEIPTGKAPTVATITVSGKQQQ